MSRQSQNIADFFKPYAKPHPAKRSRLSPGANNELSLGLALSTSDNETSTTPIKQERHISPLQTPRSGRTVSLARHGPSRKTRDPASPSRLPLTAIKRPLCQSRDGFQSELSSPGFLAEAEQRDLDMSSIEDASVNCSRRVTDAGRLVAVKDSDEESNASLESLADMFADKGHPAKSRKQRGESIEDSQEAERIELLSLFTAERSAPLIPQDGMRKLTRQQTNANFDLSRILNDHLNDEEAELKTKRAFEDIKILDREIANTKQDELDKKLLAAILQGHEDIAVDDHDMERLMLAVDRTEALQGQKSYAFFKVQRGRIRTDIVPKPDLVLEQDVPHALWMATDGEACARTFRSGILTELARQGKLADGLLEWTFKSSLFERDQESRTAYLSVIRAASPMWTRTHVTPDQIHEIFTDLGAEDTSLNATSIESCHRGQRSDHSNDDRTALLARLELLDIICDDLDFVCLSKLTPIVVRLLLDRNIIICCRCHEATQRLIEHLLLLADVQSRIHVHEAIVSDISKNLLDPILQAQWLQHFSPAQQENRLFRCKLAKVLLCAEDSSVEAEQLDLGGCASFVSSSTKFARIRGDALGATNYAVLSARVSVLDAALADCHYTESSSATVTERDFNSSVDKLVDHLQGLNASIIDVGASHMKRTDAKNAISGLCNRLIFTVRTKPRKKKHILDLDRYRTKSEAVNFDKSLSNIDTGKDRRRSAFMDKFLQRNTSTKVQQRHVPLEDFFPEVSAH